MDPKHKLCVDESSNGAADGEPSAKKSRFDDTLENVQANVEVDKDTPKHNEESEAKMPSHKGYYFVDATKSKSCELNADNTCTTRFVSFDDDDKLNPHESENQRESPVPDNKINDTDWCEYVYGVFENILKWRKLDKLNYFEFVIDPDYFDKTLRNCYLVSLLIKENKMFLEKNDGDEFPFLRKLTKDEEEKVKEMNGNEPHMSKFITTITFAKIHGLMKELNLRKPVIHISNYIGQKEFNYDKISQNANNAMDVVNNVDDLDAEELDISVPPLQQNLDDDNNDEIQYGNEFLLNNLNILAFEPPIIYSPSEDDTNTEITDDEEMLELLMDYQMTPRWSSDSD